MRRAGQPVISLGPIVAFGLLAVAIGLLALRMSRAPDSPHDATRAAIELGDDGASGVGGVVTAPARAGDNFLGRIAGMWDASGRAQRLEAENRDLMAWKALAQRLAERNARYEELLRMPPDSFGAGADPSQSIAAQLVLDSGGPFMRTLVANAGADHGVRVGYIAVNEHGLIGRVVSVGRRSARILMLDDYNSRIPVMGEASRVRAVLVGQATQPPELLTRPFAVESPRLDFIVGVANLREGERVITSGDGGVFPRGVAVGVAHAGRDGVWRVALAASQQPIDFVRILPYAGLELPEDQPVADPGPPPPRAAARPPAAAEAPAPVQTVTATRAPTPPAAERPAPPPAPTPRPAQPAPATQTAPAARSSPTAPAAAPATPATPAAPASPQ
ncbi:MAG: rod shape-determining protein MreC [Hyphomonadaceae bacterium]